MSRQLRGYSQLSQRCFYDYHSVLLYSAFKVIRFFLSTPPTLPVLDARLTASPYIFDRAVDYHITSSGVEHSKMPDRVVKLTIVNDFVCPNCCIGQHELLTAITYCKETLHLPISFELEHMPFRLINNAVLPEGTKIDRETFYANRYGKGGFEKFATGITKWAKEKNIPIAFRGVMSQSTLAHRLALKAGQVGGQELQLPILFGIFKANMEDGKDIADIQVLAEIAAGAGMMSKGEVVKFLESDELEKDVDVMCDKARSVGITGVPMIIIDGKWAVSGGQSSDVFVQIFKKLAAAGVSSTGVYSAPSPFPPPVVETAIYA
ncbi:hypothetical protein DXG01_012758 [Tephrocybe rancida]|nr:hypothetical protein DXG01_012758 [Tephrocybe rancida]